MAPEGDECNSRDRLGSLRSFFRSLPPESLQQYHARCVLGLPPSHGGPVLAGAEAEAAADTLARLLADRTWVHERLSALPKTHHVALVALLQCQGVAGGTWLLQELTQNHGMSEDLWAEVLHGLDLWVFGNSHQSPPLFYVVPDALRAELEQAFKRRLGLHAAKEDEQGEIRLSKDTNYRHPVLFSLITLLTWIRQERVRLTRKDEIFKKQLDELLAFFGDLWGAPDAERILTWYLDMTQQIGLLHQRGGFLVVDDMAMDEFLALSPRERRDLVHAWLRRKEGLLPWLLDAVHAIPARQWVPVARLKTLYRRRYMGQVFHRRYVRKSYYLPPSGFYDPNPPVEILQLGGLVESGLGPGGTYLRLSEAGRRFVAGAGWEEGETSASVRFLVQPTFEVLAPVGIPMAPLWRLGEVSQLRRADRASQYLVSRESVRRALDDGWRADDLLRFLVEEGATPLAQNVSTSIRDWVGAHGEVELHDALTLRIAADRTEAVLRVLETKGVPFENLSDTVLAIPRERQVEVLDGLREAGLDPAPRVRRHDEADAPASARGPLHVILEGAPSPDDDGGEEVAFPARSLIMLGAPTVEGGREVMAQRGLRAGRTGANAVGADLSVKPAAAGAGDLLRLSPGKTLSLVRAAIRMKQDLDILYPSLGDGDPGGLARVTPAEAHEESGASWFLARHHRLDRDVQLHIKRIQGIRLAT
jgi:hypothetical protein